ncbi:TPA: hypothetical protein DEB00_02430 [Candidatus Uhrbacteria bacterium]|nr:hypothetical protein [Candidatus Uhrbacteria bacterium]
MTKEEKNIRERVQKQIANRSQTTQVLVDLLHFGGAMSMKYLQPSRSIVQLMCDQERADYRTQLTRERQALARLIRKQFVEIRQDGHALTAQLTDSGHFAVLRHAIMETDRLLSDGKCCIVAYDIPIQLNSQRDTLRRFLKEVGFQQLQQSIWYTHKDIVEDLEVLIEKKFHKLKITVSVMKIL